MTISLTPSNKVTFKVALNTNRMSTNVVTYDLNYVMGMRHRMNQPLPTHVMKVLHMNKKIRSVMTVKDLKIFNHVLDNFNVDELKKKINALLNKLSKDK